MIKNIVYCFNGTWNKPDATSEGKTNVEEANNILLNYESKGQVVHYHSGIGTKNVIDRIIGGATGYGISNIIRKAYFQLSSAYRQGAKIYLFGFSRGAYTARSLSGFVNLVGILRPDVIIEYRTKFNRCLVSDSYIYYMLKDNEYSILNKISQKIIFKANARNDFTIKGIPFETILSWAKYEQPMIAINKVGSDDKRDFHSMTIEFLGVWDTVGSIGPPSEMLKKTVKPWVDFHDTSLSPNVLNAYQALALHEIRCHFKPVLWTKKNENQNVEQVWFAGAHSDVGGGNGHYELSNISLEWMVKNAEKNGIILNDKSVIQKGNVFQGIDIPRDTSIHKLSPPKERTIAYSEENIDSSMYSSIYAHRSVQERLNDATNKYRINCLDKGKLENIDRDCQNAFDWEKMEEKCLATGISIQKQEMAAKQKRIKEIMRSETKSKRRPREKHT